MSHFDYKDSNKTFNQAMNSDKNIIWSQFLFQIIVPIFFLQKVLSTIFIQTVIVLKLLSIEYRLFVSNNFKLVSNCSLCISSSAPRKTLTNYSYHVLIPNCFQFIFQECQKLTHFIFSPIFGKVTLI